MAAGIFIIVATAYNGADSILAAGWNWFYTMLLGVPTAMGIFFMLLGGWRTEARAFRRSLSAH